MFVITLRGSRRKADVLAEFERVGLDVEVVVRERDCEDGKRGCFQSHQHVMQMALARGLDSFAVFEDDVVFHQRSHPLPVKGIVEETIDFARRHPDAMVGLGGIATRPIGQAVNGVSCIRSACFAYTHAYVVSASVAKNVAQLKYAGRHIDQVFMDEFTHRMALVIPTIAFQRGYLAQPTTTGSSISYKVLTIMRNMISATFFQIGMEFLCRGWGAAVRLVGKRS
jgi:hypothetical protein